MNNTSNRSSILREYIKQFEKCDKKLERYYNDLKEIGEGDYESKNYYCDKINKYNSRMLFLSESRREQRLQTMHAII